MSFAVNQSQIELFSQKSRHKDIVDEKILGGLKNKRQSEEADVASPWQP